MTVCCSRADRRSCGTVGVMKVLTWYESSTKNVVLAAPPPDDAKKPPSLQLQAWRLGISAC
jgi:hypothetical protein